MNSGEARGPESPNSPASAPTAGRRWIRRLAIGMGATVVLLALTMTGAELYTARPQFCGSCHIMDPYYDSWHNDVHASKLAVRCVDCHYAPGERFTFHAKFKGLSQATSYFSGRAGGARPRAHVSDASCMVSDCHGDRAHLDKSLPIGETRMEKRIVAGQEVEIERSPTVTFVHAKHQNLDTELGQTNAAIQQTRATLKAMVSTETFEELTHVAASVEPITARREAINTIIRTGELPILASASALELDRLEHRRTRLQQLQQLSCAACHSYDASGESHFTVDRQTCFTCHFTNQAFNTETATCLKCHPTPTRMIAVHAGTSTIPAGTMMNHQEVVERGIDCASCHLDVVRGQTQVTERDCTHCHDQERYLERFAVRTIDDVDEYHRVHVATQKARCADCHHPVKHNLIEPTLVASSEGFIQPVLDNCKHCHPNHHREQVALLMGTGGEGIDQPMPNAMFGSRINCQACHTQSGTDFKGDRLIEATADNCVACHSAEYRGKLDQWISELNTRIEEARSAVDRIDRRVADLRSQNQKLSPVAEQVLNAIHRNLQLVHTGNGIHNRNYALSLLDVCNADIAKLDAMLSGPNADEQE